MIAWPRAYPLPVLPIKEDVAEQFAVDEMCRASGDHAHQRLIAYGLAARATRMVQYCVTRIDAGRLVAYTGPPLNEKLIFESGTLVMVAPPMLGIETRDGERWVRCCVRLAVAP